MEGCSATDGNEVRGNLEIQPWPASATLRSDKKSINEWVQMTPSKQVVSAGKGV